MFTYIYFGQNGIDARLNIKKKKWANSSSYDKLLSAFDDK